MESIETYQARGAAVETFLTGVRWARCVPAFSTALKLYQATRGYLHQDNIKFTNSYFV
jgi:hypothetical protein